MSTENTPRSHYRLECDCGEVLKGRRTREAQSIACPACGESFLVLPRSPYPPVDSDRSGGEGSAPSGRRKSRRTPPPLPLDPLADVDSRPVETPRSRPSPPRRRAAGPANSAANELPDERAAESAPDAELADEDFWFDRRPQEAAPPRSLPASPPRIPASKAAPIDETPVSTDPPTGLERPARRLVTPLRLVVLLIVAAIGLTVFLVSHQRSLATARQTFRAAREAGLEDFEQQRWAESIEHLEAASQAAAALGLDDAQSRLVEQRLIEATVCSELAAFSLVEGLERADAEAEAGGEYADSFADYFGDAWILIDSNVFQDSVNEARIYRIEFPVLIGGRTVELETTSSALDPMFADTKTSRVCLAAQVEFIRREQQRWIVRLNPTSIRLWTSNSALKYVGMQDELSESDSLTRLLDRQSQIQGLE